MSDEANHIYVSRTMFELLAHILDTCNPRNCYLPLAVIWVLAMNPTTLARIPTLKLVPAMMRATIANCEILKQYKEEEEAKGEAEEKANAGPSLDADIVAGDDDEGEEGEEGSRDESEGEEDSNDELDTHLAELEQERMAGRDLRDLRYWPLFALYAVLNGDPGRRAFHRFRGEKEMLPLMLHPDEIVQETVAALFALCTEASQTICSAVLEQGATQLVRMAAGRENSSFAARCTAAELLHFCLSRVRLTEKRAEDLRLLQQLPSLMTDLRASTGPLFVPLTGERLLMVKSALPGFGSAVPSGDRAAATERALTLLRAIVSALWAMAATMRIAGRPYMASSPIMALVLRLLAFKPEKLTFSLSEKAKKQRVLHGQAVRTAALGVLSCLEMRPEQVQSPSLWSKGP